MEDRNKTLYREKLCHGIFGEISKEQNRKSCANRTLCKVCSRFHCTLFHGFKNSKNIKITEIMKILTLKKETRKIKEKLKYNNGEYLRSSTTLLGLEVASICEDNNELLSLPMTSLIARSDLPVNINDITEICQLNQLK